MQYTVMIERGPTCYGAAIPHLPGCVAVAETFDEVVALIKEAVDLHLEAMREDGDQIPAPTTIDSVVEVAA